MNDIAAKKGFSILESKRKIGVCIWLALIAYSVYKIHVGLYSDEVGLVADGIRFLKGGTFIKENWFASLEGIFQVPFLWIYRKIGGGMEGSILFLRYMFLLIQMSLSLYLYRSLKPYVPKAAFLVSLFNFFYIFGAPTINYKSLLYQGTLICFLSLYNYLNTQKMLYIVISATGLSVAVLAYPTAAILAIPAIMILMKLQDENKMKPICVFLGVCLLLACLTLAYVLTYCSIGELIVLCKNILADPAHSESIPHKFLRVGVPILSIGIVENILGYWIHLYCIRKQIDKRNQFMGYALFYLFLLIVLCALRIRSAGPLRFWYVFLCIGLMEPYFVRLAETEETHRKKLYYLTYIPSLFMMSAIFMASNCGVSITAYGCAPGIIGIIILLTDMKIARPMVWLCMLMMGFTYVFFVPDYNTGSANILWKRFVLTDGSAKGTSVTKDIFEDYYRLYDVTRQYVTIDDQPLIISPRKALGYTNTSCKEADFAMLLFEPESERFTQYYKMNPENQPTVIIIDENVITDINAWMKETSLGRYISKNFNIQKPIKDNGFVILRK